MTIEIRRDHCVRVRPFDGARSDGARSDGARSDGAGDDADGAGEAAPSSGF